MQVRLAPLVSLALAIGLAACTAAPAATIPPGATPSTRIEVRLTDAMRIEPDPMVVPVGQPVTFVVTNSGVLDHEFFLGDEQAQRDHEEEMVWMGGLMHDHVNGIGVRPGETRELVYTFMAAGSTLAACHVTGHYAAGMQATVIIVP